MSFYEIILLFVIFLFCNFVFNFIWKLIEAKLTAKAIEQKMNVIYAGLIKKALSLKEDIKGSGKNDL